MRACLQRLHIVKLSNSTVAGGASVQTERKWRECQRSHIKGELLEQYETVVWSIVLARTFFSFRIAIADTSQKLEEPQISECV